MDLVLKIAKGGAEVDLGGLWLKTADIQFNQGGGDVEFSKPVKEPMSSLFIKCAMGGGSFSDLGNASPAVLSVSSSMGGADVDLGGNWLNDSEVSISAKMGGIGVSIPKGIKVVRPSDAPSELDSTNTEVSEPVLRLRTKAQYGEVEVKH